MIKSAGILLYRMTVSRTEFFLVHLGGPFWASKDEGAWSVPKGEYDESEDAFAAAQREFTEETGFIIPLTDVVPLTPIKQKSGKLISVFAAKGDCDPTELKSTLFSMEWPPRSGKQEEFPEVDRGEWFDYADATEKIHPGQAGFIEELNHTLHP